MAEFRDWRAPFRIARERLLEARRNGLRAPLPFTPENTPQELLQIINDANERSERAVEPTPTVKTKGRTRPPPSVETPHGRAKKTTKMQRGGVVLGSRPGTKAFYKEKSLQAPEPYIERIDDFGEGGGGVRGGIKSTILSSRTGEELKDQAGARRRMTQGAVTRHAKAVANSEPAVETEPP